MNDKTTDAASIFAPLWKRKWLILVVGLAVAAGTYVYYKHQPAKYQAKTQLYLGGSNEAQSILAGNAKGGTSARELANQVELINSSIVGEPVRKGLRKAGDRAAAKGKAKATASATASFIDITTEARTPRSAKALANAYARGYIARQQAAYFRRLREAIANAHEQLRRIESASSAKKGSKGNTSASSAIQSATLATKINQLESGLSGFNGVEQVGKAKATPLPLSPAPKKNAIFGFVLGVLLASIAAYVLSRLDRRITSVAEVERIFSTRILAALPKVRSPIVRPNGERAPARPLLEPLRRLHTTLQLSAEHAAGPPCSILFVSADPGDGKSTLVTNLARVQRDAGVRVAVLEADFRRPVLGRMLDVSAPHGLAEVLNGVVSFEDATETVEASPQHLGVDGGDRTTAAVATAVQPQSTGSLSALLSRESVENPPALLAGRAMAELLHSLVEDFESVLIDAPPPLEVSDVMPLLALVDGVVIVVRIGHTRDQAAERLAELLAGTAGVRVLGVVANCVAPKDMERYGFAVRQARGRRRSGLRPG